MSPGSRENGNRGLNFKEVWTHAELMKQDGIYHRFVDSRRQAIGWKIKPELLRE